MSYADHHVPRPDQGDTDDHLQYATGADTVLRGNLLRNRFADDLVPEIEAETLARKLLQQHMPTGATVLDLPEHMKGTPRRFNDMLSEMTSREEFQFTTFPSDSDDMVVLDPIPFYTLCAHHVVPFFGHAYIGYVPGGRIAGLSKFARAVEYCAKGFHVQEELTRELANFLEQNLFPGHTTDSNRTNGMAVVMRAEHLCMAMRGVRAAGVKTTTSRMTGVFADHTRTAKAEFMQIIQAGGWR